MSPRVGKHIWARAAPSRSVSPGVGLELELLLRVCKRRSLRERARGRFLKQLQEMPGVPESEFNKDKGPNKCVRLLRGEIFKDDQVKGRIAVDQQSLL